MKPKRPSTQRSAPRGSAAGAPRARVGGIDALRGVAIVMMIAFHFCFDLTWFGWAHWRLLEDPAWIAWRDVIVTSFLLLSGVSLVLRDAHKPAWSDFRRRWLQVAGAALLVTAGSDTVFPASFIYFGVLHFVALALLLARPMIRFGAWNLLIGALVLTAGMSFSTDTMDARALNWIGFAAHKPITEDYVPLFPWLGVMLIGCGLGSLWRRRDFATPPTIAALAALPPARLVAGLALLGRWSLSIYLVHQPLLIGAMMIVARLKS